MEINVKDCLSKGSEQEWRSEDYVHQIENLPELKKLKKAKRFPFELFPDTCKSFLIEQYKREASISEIDADSIKHIEQVVEWLCSSHKTGLILMGNVGNGKTTLMNATVKLLSTAMRNVSSSNYHDYDYFYKNSAKKIARQAREETNFFEETIKFMAIDDVGEETKEVLSFGNAVYPLTDIIENRYESKKILIITTNLDYDAIRVKYGDRVYDRLREMMYVISFTNPSYRLP